MDELYFLVRFTPFWAVPLMIIGAEFTYIFWLRKKKKLLSVSLIFSIIGAVSTSLYYIAGGPEKSVWVVMKLIHFYTT